jgi:poly-gamma-glutamate synthesis protein (capsule biosynthesis protein)
MDNSNYTILIVHGGHETFEYPRPRMKKLYRYFIDVGVDVVIGHHTHCFSGHEIYKGKPIFYSLGNFVFDQNWSKKTSVGEVIVLVVNKEKIIKESKYPYTIKFNSQPQFD